MSATASHIRITLKGFDHSLLDTASKTIVDAAERSGAAVAGPVPLPVRKKRFTLNRSTFVHKDARDQYELRIHKRLLDIKSPSSAVVAELQNLHLPAGVEVALRVFS